MKFDPVVIRSQTPLPKYFSSIVKDGAQVFVRVLKEESPGRYIVSLGNGRFPFRSQKHFSVGQTFFAKVNITSQGVKLSVLPKSQNSTPPAAITNLSSQSQFKDFFASLGLEFNPVSQKILSTLMSLGVKFDKSKAQKALRISRAFKECPQRAAGAAIQLIEKGIDPDIDNVSQLLFDFEGGTVHGQTDSNGTDGDGSQDENGERLEQTQTAGDLENLESLLFSYFTKCLEGKFSDRGEGLLPLLNQMPPKTYVKSPHDSLSKTWIVLPFELETPDKPACGNLKLFLDLVNQCVEKAVIEFNFVAKSWKFVVKYNKRQCASIHFACFPELNDSEKLKRLLVCSTGITSVEYMGFDRLDEFGTDDLSVMTVKGFA